MVERSAAPAPPFWLVWNRNGRKPVVEHDSYHKARAEAERLARACPGNSFYVLAPACRGGSDAESLVWSHYVPCGIGLIDDFDGEHGPKGLDE